MQIVHEAEGQAWSVRWADLMLHLRLVDGTLLADYFGPASGQMQPNLPGPEVLDALTRTRGDTSVHLALDSRLPFWSCQDWAQTSRDTLTITLKASNMPLSASMIFTVDVETGVLLRRTTLRHTGPGAPLEISHTGSMTFVLPADIDEVVHLAGRWGAETQVQRMPLLQTALLLESRSGKSGFEFSPYISLLAPGRTYFSQLYWSGNWQYYVRRQAGGRVVLAGGLNPWGFRHRMEPGDTLELPVMLLGCVAGDLNHATQQLHQYERGRGRIGLAAHTRRPVAVQFNSWFPYQGEPPVDAMKAYATQARNLGCEVFILDAGWYTTEHENLDEGWWLRAGDWVVSRKLFPEGLEELSTHCRELGIDFGIWIEPEAVGPSAGIRRAHPEWLHAIGGLEASEGDRAILNLGVPEARTWIRERMLSILRSTGARWLKWDFNMDLYQGGWAPGISDEIAHQDPIMAHYNGLYLLMQELLEACPELTLETCSSGGGRFDAAILARSHAYWISDQTHPLMKLAIHFGSQLTHPPEQCNDWLTEWPPHEAQHDPLRSQGGEHGDLSFRLGVAMLGSFGISAPLARWSHEDTTTVREHVAWYKEGMRPLLPTSRQYMLTEAPPLDGDGNWAAIWYVQPDGDSGALFAFRLANGAPERSFALPGLNPQETYRLMTPAGQRTTLRGDELAAGYAAQVAEPFGAVLLSVQRVEFD